MRIPSGYFLPFPSSNGCNLNSFTSKIISN
jgi:hypothetical protein